MQKLVLHNSLVLPERYFEINDGHCLDDILRALFSHDMYSYCGIIRQFICFVMSVDRMNIKYSVGDECIKS